MSNKKYAPTVLDKLFSANVYMPSWMLLMLTGIPLIIIATSILIPSLQSSLSFTPMLNGIKASGTIMEITDTGKDYPNFKPDPRVAGLHYKEATVQYSHDSQFYNLRLDTPIPDVGKETGDTIPLLVDPQTPSKAVADIYPVPYNMTLIVTMGILNAVGLSLVIISLILRKRPTFRVSRKR